MSLILVRGDGRRGRRKKRMLDEAGFNSVTSALPDEKKHRVETDAARAGIAEPAPDFVVPHEGGSVSVLPSVVNGAPGAGSKEPPADVVVLWESSELEVDGSPIVEIDATGAGAATTDPAPDIVVPYEGDGALGLPSVETIAPGAGSAENALPDIVVPQGGGCGSTATEPHSKEPVTPGYVSSQDSDIIPPSPSPRRDLKSAKSASFSKAIFGQLGIKLGSMDGKVLEAIVTPSNQPGGFVVASILLNKLNHYSWSIAQSHQHGDSSYCYIKMTTACDASRFHVKMYGFGEAQVAFCSVDMALRVQPDPIDAHAVLLLA